MMGIAEILNSFTLGSLGMIIIFASFDDWDFELPLTKYWFIANAFVLIATTVILRVG